MKPAFLISLALLSVVGMNLSALADCNTQQGQVKNLVTEYTQKVKSGTYIDPINYGSKIGVMIADMEDAGCHQQVDELQPFMEKAFDPYHGY